MSLTTAATNGSFFGHYISKMWYKNFHIYLDLHQTMKCNTQWFTQVIYRQMEISSQHNLQ